MDLPRSRSGGGGAACAAAAFLFPFLTTIVLATDLAYKRAVNATLASSAVPTETVEKARDVCDTALCFAERLAAELPNRVRLEKVDHPDTDAIRWVTTAPSLFVDDATDTLGLNLPRFGRKAVAELREALAGAGRRLALDLRGNTGGDFERMLEIAGLLLGPRAPALTLRFPDRTETRSLDGPATRRWRVERVLIDEETASAALALARLLAVHGKADLVGPDDGSPIDLTYRIPIDHDWRLILPIGAITIP